MSYADFHVHGSFKTFFSGYNVQDKKSPWEKIEIVIDRILYKKPNRILSSQSCFSQLKDGLVTLAVIPLYSAERGFAESTMMKFLDLTSDNINNRFFRDVRSNKKTYWQQLDDCYNHLYRAKTDDINGHINFTRCFEDFIGGEMNIVLSMEGGHCFLDSSDDIASPAGIDKIVDRIKSYKKRDPESPFPRVFILNLTHLTQAPFSNHGFGIKMIAHKDFIPHGRGISLAGLKIIETALSHDEQHYPIIIDIKHMSWESRKEYYALRRNNYPEIPVIASHAGCTGISIDNVNDYIEEINSPVFNKKSCNLVSYTKPWGILPNTEYNPWSINLYDEDISEILLSGGIIGLSLDQRILGCGKVVREKMSKDESFICNINLDRPLLANDPDEGPGTRDAELHFRHFCNNLFHIVDVGQRISDFNDDPWTRIVIGSDFDGFIDPVDFCMDATQYNKIEEWMTLHLPALAAEANISLPNNLVKTIRGILYDNGFNFLKTYYSKTFLLPNP